MNIPYKVFLCSIFYLSVLIVVLPGCSKGEEKADHGEAKVSKASFESVIFTRDSYRPSRNNGSQIYLDRCAQCHGGLGKGDGSAQKTFGFAVPDLSFQDALADISVAEAAEKITAGDPLFSMPAFKTILTSKEIADVSAYVMTLSAKTEGINRGEIIYERYCFSCHGLKGEGDGTTLLRPSEKADIADPARAAFRSRSDMVEVISKGRKENSMPAFQGVIASSDLKPLTDYLLLLTYQP